MSDMTQTVGAPGAEQKTGSRGRLDLLFGLIFLLLAIAAPFVIESRYLLGQVILGLFWASVAVQWNLLFGYAGVFSLGQMAVFAVGGYGTAMLAHYLDWNIFIAIGGGAVVATVFSALVGLACLRLQGVYVALLTFAIAQVIYLLIVTDTSCFEMVATSCRQFTGGATGFARFGDFGTRQLLRGDWLMGNYAIVLVCFLLSLLASWIILHGPMGLAFKALRDNPAYAVARGINRFHTQLLVFGISAFFTGLTGGLYATHFQAIGPGIFSMSSLLFILAITVVGGVGSFWGPVVGTVVLMVADELMREAGQFRTIGLGLIIAAAVVLLPQGLVGRISDIAKRLRG